MPAPHVPHLSSNLFSTLLRTLSESCSDQWRLQLLQIIQNTAAISCSQAAAILGCFETQDVSKPLQLLLMSIHDVPNISVFETVAVEYADACGSSALDEAYEQLRCPSASSLAHNPSGHYKLDLTNQVRPNLQQTGKIKKRLSQVLKCDQHPPRAFSSQKLRTISW